MNTLTLDNTADNPSEMITPKIIERVKAAVYDSIAVLGMLVLAYYVISFFRIESILVKQMVMVGIFVLYDPIATSFLGGTIGHYIMGIRVKRATNTEKNISLPLALVRFLIKALLGVISLFTISGNQKSMAIHDMAVNSIVVYR